MQAMHGAVLLVEEYAIVVPIGKEWDWNHLGMFLYEISG